MTKVYLHGILGKKFGNFFKFRISNAVSAIKALEANRDGFIQKLKSLSEEGYNYMIIIDDCIINNHLFLQENKKINSIHFIPSINGRGPVSGPAAAIIGSTILGSTLAAQIVAFAINMIIMSAISLGVSLIAAALTKRGAGPQTASQNYVSLAGVTTQLENTEKSYVFSNRLNTADQGATIPIGYGKVKIASKIISNAILSYPQTVSPTSEFTKTAIGIYPDFLSF